AYVPGEVLVQWKPEYLQQDVVALTQTLPGFISETIETPLMRATGSGRVDILQVQSGMTVEQAIAELQADPRVEHAEPNWIFQSTAVSNDPSYTTGGMWGMYSGDSPVAAGPTGTTNVWGSQAEQVWNNGVTGSSRVIVGVIDEGIQATHPDLVDNIWVNPYETPGDGIDNDGNGYIDDVRGWDFVNNDNNVNDGSVDSHGTHVAGTIGAQGGNALGVTGVAWDVSMISLKFLGSTGGTVSRAIRAIDYLTDLKVRHGIYIVASNNSWGGGAYSRVLHEAIIRGAKQDILFVAAAGNSSANNDTVASFPANFNTSVGTAAMTAASYDAVISVAAITESGSLASFSNFGKTSVDIGAPGNAILSTSPGGYATRNGTSMAAPHVTGTIALFASAHAGRVPAAAIRSAIISSASPTPSLAGKTVSGGRLNALEALRRSASIAIDRDVYGPAESLSVTVTSVGGNANSQLPDTLTIQVQSTTETSALSVTLTETGNATGIFRGTVQLASGAAAADSLLQVSHGDQITATIPGLALSDSATVDALPPSISNISLTSTASTAAVSWNTSELASAVVRFGRSPDALDRFLTIATTATAQSSTLHALDAAAGYYCRIEATDVYGNTQFSAIQSFSTLPPAPILFVDDDHGATFDSHFRNALNAGALAFDEWNVFSGGRLPAAANLAQYQLVIWNTGAAVDAPQAGLSAEEQTAIAAYLDAGGRIYLSGQGILFNGVSADFRQNYLKIAGYLDDAISGSHTETGVVGSEITADLTLPVTVPDGYPALLIDAVTPAPGANGLLQHNIAGLSPAWTGVSYRGNYSAGGFGMVFSTLPLESISPTAAAPNNQAAFLQRIVDFLNTSVSPEIQIIPPSADRTSEAGAATSFGIVLTTQPSDTVTIPLTSSSSSEGSVSTASVTFTSANWNIPQTITVSGVDDFVDDGDIAWQVITGPAVSTDPRYQGLNPTDPGFINQDDDTAGITISALSGPSTTESGGRVSFTVRLASQPLAPVTLSMNSTNSNEGTVSAASLVFTTSNWNLTQTVTVTGVDDTARDGDVTYGISIFAAISSDSLYHGIDPADFTVINLDNDLAQSTKFYAVDDGAADHTFEYDASGGFIESHAVSSENNAPRGIATIAAADRLWVVDANRRVFVYDTAGGLLGSWTAGLLYTVADVQGIATDGTHIWILDRLTDRVFYFANAASRLSGTMNYTSAWILNRRNSNATDMVFGSQNGQQFLWILNEASLDHVYRYTLNTAGIATAFSSWQLDITSSSPTGIALDPSNETMDLWIADNTHDRVFRYGNGRTAVAPVIASSFELAVAAGNTNIQGIADPPPPATEAALPGYRPATPGSVSNSALDQPAAARSAAVSTTETAAPSADLIPAPNSATRVSPGRLPARPKATSRESVRVTVGEVSAPAAPRATVPDLFSSQTELDLLLRAL
ncbi:MAG: hypothetical protein RLZZ436_1122, partial [Planctomycetota bacterium]